MLQGFIVLFSGAMTYVIAPILARLLGWVSKPFVRQTRSEATHG